MHCIFFKKREKVNFFYFRLILPKGFEKILIFFGFLPCFFWGGKGNFRSPNLVYGRMTCFCRLMSLPFW